MSDSAPRIVGNTDPVSGQRQEVVLPTNKRKYHETLEVIVSDSAFFDGYFGVYGIASDDPAVQLYLSGGYNSVHSAIDAANSIITKMRETGLPIPDNHSVEYKRRDELQIPDTYLPQEKEQIIETVTDHINELFPKIDKKLFLRNLLSYGNIVFFGTCTTIWIYWTNGEFTVPHFDFPIVGQNLSGKVLNSALVASYYPLALFVLFSASFFKMLNVNLSNDELRRKLIVLFKKHGWTVRDLAKIVTNSLNKNAKPWLWGLMRWIDSNDLNSLSGLLKEARGEGGGGDAAMRKVPSQDKTELSQNLQRWVVSDYDQRLHNLLFMDRDKNFSAAYMCFDPIMYVINNNRTVFRLYSFLKSRGYNVNELNAPQDPYKIERFMPFTFGVGIIFSILFLGGTCLWSLLIEHSSFWWTVLGVVTSLAVLVLPNWWNYRAVIGRKGFPRTEPIGAYTIGRAATNRLSLVGW